MSSSSLVDLRMNSRLGVVDLSRVTLSASSRTLTEPLPFDSHSSRALPACLGTRHTRYLILNWPGVEYDTTKFVLVDTF